VLRLWEVESKRPLTKWQGHAAPVDKLVFVKGAHQLVSCARDGEVCSWDLDGIRERLRELGLAW
jgi:hypothetical protein